MNYEKAWKELERSLHNVIASNSNQMNKDTLKMVLGSMAFIKASHEKTSDKE